MFDQLGGFAPLNPYMSQGKSRDPNISECFRFDMGVHINSTPQDITDVGADTSYVRIYMTCLLYTSDAADE